MDALTLEDSRLGVVATVARLRGMSAQLALSASRDLGEAVVVGHARVLADAGHEVYVVIDDQGGQALASSSGLPTWEASKMKQLYDEWRQSQKQRRTISGL